MYKNIDLIFANLELEVEEKDGSYVSCCPIHDDSDNPTAFTYSINKNIWKCWTHGCHEEYNTDIFGLIRGVLSKNSGQEVSFGHTLKWVMQVLNLDSKTVDTINIQKQAPDSFLGLVKKFYKEEEEIVDSVGQDWNVNIPSEYFISRGFEAETLKYFGVGDCNGGGFMKHRSVIPIHNKTGDQVVGSIGRAIYDYMDAKFIIEPGCEKVNYLYNQHRAEKRIRETNCAFINEGQGNVWRLYECAVHNAVSIFGKDMSVRQNKLLSEMGVTTLVVLLDNDQAGREAKIQFQRKYDRLYRLIFPKVSTRRDVAQMSPDDVDSKILVNLRGLY